jgi:hypothetical protein
MFSLGLDARFGRPYPEYQKNSIKTTGSSYWINGDFGEKKSLHENSQ